MNHVKLIAFDLDGTLTQHKQPLSEENRRTLDALAQRYRLVMVGAGQVGRIFRQMGNYPIDIIGNYGMQYACYDKESRDLQVVRDLQLPCDREEVAKRIAALRRQFGYEVFAGESVEYHPSGCVTFPLLGTKAKQEDKLAFDPDRTKRRAFYDEVVKTFADYCVFVGGSSSFDFAPKKYNKYDSIMKYASEHGYQKEDILFIGDDFGDGGGDSHVRIFGLDYVQVDDYTQLPVQLDFLL